MKQFLSLIALIALVKCDTPGLYPAAQAGQTDSQNGFVPASAPYPAVGSSPYPAAGSSPYPASGTKDVGYSQMIDNPAYDPNMYSSFVPQDSVQQYVNSYGAGGVGAGGVGAGFGGVGGGFGGVGGGGYGGPGFGGPIGGTPYAAGYGGVDPSGFAVQSGYEGFLVPSFPPGGYNYLRPFNGIFKSLLPHPKAFLAIIAKIGFLIFSTIGTVLIGGLVTTLLCAFTSVCHISFANLPFLKLKETAKEITTTLGQEITPDRVKRAAEFVKNAIAKYSQLQESATTV